MKKKRFHCILLTRMVPHGQPEGTWDCCGQYYWEFRKYAHMLILMSGYPGYTVALT